MVNVAAETLRCFGRGRWMGGDRAILFSLLFYITFLSGISRGGRLAKRGHLPELILNRTVVAQELPLSEAPAVWGGVFQAETSLRRGWKQGYLGSVAAFHAET